VVFEEFEVGQGVVGPFDVGAPSAVPAAVGCGVGVVAVLEAVGAGGRVVEAVTFGVVGLGDGGVDEADCFGELPLGDMDGGARVVWWCVGEGEVCVADAPVGLVEPAGVASPGGAGVCVAVDGEVGGAVAVAAGAPVRFEVGDWSADRVFTFRASGSQRASSAVSSSMRLRSWVWLGWAVRRRAVMAGSCSRWWVIGSTFRVSAS